MVFRKALSRGFSRIDQSFRLRDAHGGGKYRVARGAYVGQKSRVGAWTYIEDGTHVGIGTSIGRYCAIARNADIGPAHHDYNLLTIHDFPTQRTRFAGVPGYMGSTWKPVATSRRGATVLKNDVWIGVKATVLRGVHVETGAVVGAHALVTKDVPPYAIVGGVPARIIRYRFPRETIEALLASRWWLLDPAELDAFDLTNPAESAKAILERTKSMPVESR